MEEKQCCKNKFDIESHNEIESKKCCSNNQINSNNIVINNESDCYKKIKLFYPLLLSFSYVIFGAIISEYPFNSFNWKHFFQMFMGLLLLLFSYVKLLNPHGFVNTFKKYDIITKKFNLYGYIYPLIEATLGIFYIINFIPTVTNSIIIALLTFNLIQVIIVIIKKEDLECACMGSLGFKLPLTYVTITEDLIMIIMAIIMIIFSYTT